MKKPAAILLSLASVFLFLCPMALPADDPSCYVMPLDLKKLNLTEASDREIELAVRYYACIEEWGRLLSARYVPYEKIPGAGYYGGDTNEETDIRSACYAVLVNAFLSAISHPNYDSDKAHQEDDDCMLQLRGTLRFLCATHCAAAMPCPNGKPWGNQPQSAMWTRSMGLGAWFVWDDLDANIRAGAARVIEFEADRLLGTQPSGQEHGDTRAEENAWSAQVLSLAANMMPGHPRAAQWEQQAKLLMYNSLSAKADMENEGVGDDGKPVCEWVKTVNIHPDYTIENEGYVDIHHLGSAIAFLGENCLPYLLADKTPPRGALHNVKECYEVYKCFMAWDGSPIYVSGTDFSPMIHTQAADIFTHVLCSIMLNDAYAAYLELKALDFAEQIQARNKGHYNVGTDMTFNGMCASAMIDSYILHALKGLGPEPVDATRFNLDATRSKEFKDAKIIIHRTPAKFASFSWGRKRLVLALPASGNWTIWPHPASYIGLINGEPPDEEHSKLLRCNITPMAHGFTATCHLSRLGGKVDHYISFASLPDDVVVFTDLRVAAEDVEIASQQIGIIGVEYPLDKNERDIYTLGSKLTVRGLNRESDCEHIMTSPWLNLDNYVGYVVTEMTGGPRNDMLYFNQAHPVGRIPKLQEWVALHNLPKKGSYRKGDTIGSACIITFLNQPWRKTQRAQETTGGGLISDKFLFCVVGAHIVAVNFGDEQMALDPEMFCDVTVEPFSTTIRMRESE